MPLPPVARALVICNGEAPSRRLLRRLASEADLVVAADGGANRARALGVAPDLIIGDLDSVTRATRRHFSRVPVLHVARQDNTDLEKALDYLAARGVRSAVVTAAAGRRIDFTIANLAVLWNYASLMDLRAVGDGWQAVPVRRRLEVRAPRGTTVSLIPFGPCDGVTLRGFRYPLRNASMRVGELGVSNVVRAARSAVILRRGHLLAVILDDRASVRGPAA